MPSWLPGSLPTQSRRRLLAVIGALSLTAAACGGSDGPTAENAEATAEETADSSSLLFGEFATLSGSSVDLDSLQGKDVVLWFWAPW